MYLTYYLLMSHYRMTEDLLVYNNPFKDITLPIWNEPREKSKKIEHDKAF